MCGKINFRMLLIPGKILRKQLHQIVSFFQANSTEITIDLDEVRVEERRILIPFPTL